MATLTQGVARGWYMAAPSAQNKRIATIIGYSTLFN